MDSVQSPPVSAPTMPGFSCPTLVPGEALPQPDLLFPFSCLQHWPACLVYATQMTGKKYAIGMQPVPLSQNY